MCKSIFWHVSSIPNGLLEMRPKGERLGKSSTEVKMAESLKWCAEKVVTECRIFFADPLNNPVSLAIAIVLVTTCKFHLFFFSDHPRKTNEFPAKLVEEPQKILFWHLFISQRFEWFRMNDEICCCCLKQQKCTLTLFISTLLSIIVSICHQYPSSLSLS